MSEINVSATLEIDDHELDERIIHAAAEQLLSQISLTSRYGGAVPDLIQAKLSEIVSERITAMLDKPVVQVDRWGDQVKGTPKTFRDVFADTADGYLAARVNNDGRPAEGGYHTISRLEWLIRQVGATHLEQECRNVAAQFKKELQEKAKQALALVVAEQVQKVR